MIKQSNIDEINSSFLYQRDDSRIDDWDVLDTSKEQIKGDCEDYALTLLWLESKENLIRFVFNILLHRYTIYFCKAPNGEGHAVLKHDGYYIDNIQRKLVTKKDLQVAGYKRFIPAPNFVVLIRLLVGLAL